MLGYILSGMLDNAELQLITCQLQHPSPGAHAFVWLTMQATVASPHPGRSEPHKQCLALIRPSMRAGLCWSSREMLWRHTQAWALKCGCCQAWGQSPPLLSSQ